jgi:hypothetical protein
MASQIGRGQSACIPDVFCIENLIQLWNIMAASATSPSMKNAIMNIDLEKAFDRVDHWNHHWYDETLLKWCHFQGLCVWLSNRHGSIDIKNFVRQGCPLSMNLFVLYIEPLIREMSLEVSGANVGIETIKVLGYADDINFVVQNDVESDRVFKAV